MLAYHFYIIIGIMKSVEKAIKDAELLLPGIPAKEDEIDPRWQAIIKIGDFIQDEPQEVWKFIEKWGKNPSIDIRLAIATCLLEHLLECHFKEYFPLVKETALNSKRFAFTFKMCSQFGQATEPINSKAFLQLK